MANVRKVDVIESAPKVELEVMPPMNLPAEETAFRFDIEATFQKARDYTDALQKDLGDAPTERTENHE